MGSVLSECSRDGSKDSSRDREVLVCKRTAWSTCLDGGAFDSLHQEHDGDDDSTPRTPRSNRSDRMEGLMRELFKLHDLNGNGLLEEVELVKLNEKIAILHCGYDTDRAAVRERYSAIFRDRMNPQGQAATYSTFRQYMYEILDSLDPDEPTQTMILQQLIAEADLALAAFPASLKIRCGTLASLPMQKPQLQALGKTEACCTGSTTFSVGMGGG
eukprot:TRINITY_DN10865_c0_g2_i1.p1 TRINITY_DN10865_c0_g2~~TRINITY_DN10865_c0_g2_i1.p1  ORF type:complete len:215 (-),score=55.92 TRINITY_DN10865_c0_g2_i1:234-878(-)